MKYKIENYFASPVSDDFQLQPVKDGNGVIEQDEVKSKKGFIVYDEIKNKVINIEFDPVYYKWDGTSVVKDVEYLEQQEYEQNLKLYNSEKDKVRNFLIDFEYGMAYDKNFDPAIDHDKEEVLEYINNLSNIISKKMYTINNISRPKILENY